MDTGRDAQNTMSVRSVGDVLAFVRAAIGPSYGTRAAVVVVGLDDAHRVVGLAENRRRWTPRSFDAAELVALAASLGARAIVLVQFVPNKRTEPSIADAHDFRTLARRCAASNTAVLDCIVVSTGRCWSLARIAPGAVTARSRG